MIKFNKYNGRWSFKAIAPYQDSKLVGNILGMPKLDLLMEVHAMVVCIGTTHDPSDRPALDNGSSWRHVMQPTVLMKIDDNHICEICRTLLWYSKLFLFVFPTSWWIAIRTLLYSTVRALNGWLIFIIIIKTWKMLNAWAQVISHKIYLINQCRSFMPMTPNILDGRYFICHWYISCWKNMQWL